MDNIIIFFYLSRKLCFHFQGCMVVFLKILIRNLKKYIKISNAAQRPAVFDRLQIFYLPYAIAAL